MKIYGQLNELRETIMNKVTQNKDLLKFVFYCDLVEINKILESLGQPKVNTIKEVDILSLPDLTKTQIKSLYDTQIFKYKRMPIKDETEAKCFLSMQFGKVGRSMNNPYWMQPYFEFTIVCPESILETYYGDRILAIEQCLADTFEFQSVGNVGNVRISGSTNTTVDTGFVGRIVQLYFIDWIDRK